MILGFYHAALYVSSEKTVDFYKKLGFYESAPRIERPQDTIVFMDGPCPLEIFIDPSRKPGMKPDPLGLTHLALHVDDVEKTLEEFGIEAKITHFNGGTFAFFKDPDGQSLEFHD